MPIWSIRWEFTYIRKSLIIPKDKGDPGFYREAEAATSIAGMATHPTPSLLLSFLLTRVGKLHPGRGSRGLLSPEEGKHSSIPFPSMLRGTFPPHVSPHSPFSHATASIPTVPKVMGAPVLLQLGSMWAGFSLEWWWQRVGRSFFPVPAPRQVGKTWGQ